ncbi:winged helix-turn-helix domain-containing protein [Kitasatospora sp. NBC_00374]|uniref:ArsR/SmtB family transcription factor n=1 Tax=Kitasatospora sp. NBC_00374 TaxID=2975964 RepID=UPI0030E058C3
MLELAFSARDLARTRLAVSPLWETVTSLRVLQSERIRPLHLRWAARTRPRLRDLALLTALVPVHGYIPDFLNPPAASAVPSFDAELATVARTGHARIRADLGRLTRWTPEVQAFHDDPAAGLTRLTAELTRYWEVALAPYWPRLRAVLEADVLHQSRRFAAEGAAAVLRELNPHVEWGDEVLSIPNSLCGSSSSLAGRGLLLVPSAFVGPSVLIVDAPPETVQMCYPTRGVGTLWEQAPAQVPDAVAAVLGKSRALLLTELAEPASTTELSRRTGLSAAGVSQHLTALRAAGIVTSHRAGRSVLYQRTAVADTLLAAAAG